MNILGISAFYHDSAAAVICDGKIIAAAQEERFTRIKHDPAFPANAVSFCLSFAGLKADELDYLVFYEKPFLKFERLLETYYAFAPRGLSSFVKAMPAWLKEKLFLKRIILKELKKSGHTFPGKIQILFPEHHLSHAASAFYPSPFTEAAIISLDGVGEWATAGIFRGNSNRLEVLKETCFPHSTGLLYSAFTYFLGFTVNSGEYKLMGLSPYGNHGSERVKSYISTIRSELVEIFDDGSIRLNQEYFSYASGLKMIREKKWKKLFGFPRRKPESEIEQQHCDLALAIQEITNEIVLKMAIEAKRLCGSDNLCMAGGVALNCVANGKLKESGIFKNIYIQPASGDAGGAIGAALAAYYIYKGENRNPDSLHDSMQGAFLGPEFSDDEIIFSVKKYNAVFARFDDFDSLAIKTAELLAGGNICGWFQGRMEFGPRALGNRSILADARNPEMQKKLNLKIKFREGFRPFAPAVLEEYKSEYFETDTASPYMLFTAGVRKSRRNPLPDNYNELPMMDRLYLKRSDIPSVTHTDFSARLQTVHRETNDRFWTLISKFRELTGYGLVVNTSFNVRGEPIVCTAEEAYACFMRTEMDYLVMGNCLFEKTQQPQSQDVSAWKKTFKPD